MPETKKLFDEFPPISAEQWVKQVVKDLKGESFDEKLKYTSADGISISPFYTAEDLAKYSERKPLFSHADWEVCETIDVVSETDANKLALHALNNGVSGLVFKLKANADLAALLKDIQIEYIATQFIPSEDAAAFSKRFLAYLNSKGIDASVLNSSIVVDPVAEGFKSGEWAGVESAKKGLVDVHLTGNAIRTVSVDATVYANAGASQAYEIACALAQLHTTLQWLSESGMTLSWIKTVQLNVAVGPDYFFEIAKLRAYRKVAALLFEEYKMDAELYIHAETSFRNMTVFDAHNNLLRATSEAMAATIGGCNSLYVLPFDAAFAEKTEFSSRLSRNIQLVLKSESYFDKVADVSAGSYFIEELTEQLSEKAWNYFVEIEKSGGIVACLEKGLIAEKIKSFADVQQQKFDQGKEVLVGTNKFPNTKEDKKSIEKSIRWNNELKKASIVKTLETERLSAKNEKERLANN